MFNQLAASSYMDDKQKYFNSLISARKREIGYLTPKKAKDTKIKCEQCVYMEAFTPYLQRCQLISFDDKRSASVSLYGSCSLVSKDNFDQELIKKLVIIQYENIKAYDVINWKRAK